MQGLDTAHAIRCCTSSKKLHRLHSSIPICVTFVTCDILCHFLPDFHRFQWYEMRVERNSREEAAGGAPLCLPTLRFSIAAHQPLSSADASTLLLLRKRDGLLLNSAAYDILGVRVAACLKQPAGV